MTEMGNNLKDISFVKRRTEVVKSREGTLYIYIYNVCNPLAKLSFIHSSSHPF